MKIVIEIPDDSETATKFLDINRRIGAQPATDELGKWVRDIPWAFILWNMVVDRSEAVTLRNGGKISFERTRA